VALLALAAAILATRLPLFVPLPSEAATNGEKRNDGDGPIARMLIPLYAAMLCGGLTYRALVTTMPTFLVDGDSAGEGLRKGGAITLAVLAVGGVGQLLGGRLSDRMRPTLLYFILIVGALPAALLLGLGAGAGTIAGAAILAFFTFSVQPVENNLLAQASPSHRRATLYGLKFAPAFGIGALGTPAVGWIWAQTGDLANVFLLIAVFLGTMAVLAGFIAARTRSMD
jgi:MFS family permease